MKLSSSIALLLTLNVHLSEGTTDSKQRGGVLSQLVDICINSVCEMKEMNGVVDDCMADAKHVQQSNAEHFYPLLNQLVRTNFFKYFKVNLWKQCPFWKEDHMCMMKDCSVEECAPEEVPWLDEEPPSSESSQGQGQGGGCNDPVGDDSLGWIQSYYKENYFGWNAPDEAEDNLWIVQDGNQADMRYVNLLDNPERFTGYKGEAAHKIWNAIYQENCFDGDDNLCFEERVFYRLISGFQASVTTHLTAIHLGTGGSWGPDVQQYVGRVGSHPTRLNNLHFAYLFVLRSIDRVRDTLLTMDYDTGNRTSDIETKALMNRLLSPEVLGTCHEVVHGFDETLMFRDEKDSHEASYMLPSSRKTIDNSWMKHQMRNKFRNISRIMDCVGCQKCRLWGKLQVLGFGTALKILFNEGGVPSLQRNEVIALINLMKNLAFSVSQIDSMRDLEWQQAVQFYTTGFAAVSVLLLFGGLYLRKVSSHSSRLVTKVE